MIKDFEKKEPKSIARGQPTREVCGCIINCSCGCSGESVEEARWPDRTSDQDRKAYC